METPGSATRRSTRVKRKPFSDLTNSPSLSSLNPKPKPGPLPVPVPEPETSDPQPVPSTSGDQENEWDQQGTPSKFMEVSPGFFSNADSNDEARISTVYTRVKARRKIVKAAPSLSCPPVGKNRSIEYELLISPHCLYPYPLNIQHNLKLTIVHTERPPDELLRRHHVFRGSMRLKGNDADQSFSVPPDRAKKKKLYKEPEPVQRSILPGDFVEEQRAYFAEIDAFELPEEEVSDNDEATVK